MAGLLDFLRPQGAQAPGAMSQPSGLARLLAPEVALPMAAALMGNQGNMQNLGNAFQMGGQGLQAQKADADARAQDNKTYEFFKTQAPEFAQMIDAGMPISEAWQGYTKQKYAQPAADSRPTSIQEFEMTQKDPKFAEFMRSGKGRDSSLLATDRQAIRDSEDSAMSSNNTIQMLESVLSGEPGQSLNDRAGSGAMAGSQSWLARNDPTGFFDDSKGEATTELQNVVLGQALSSLKSIFGAAPTEGERKILVELQASIDKTPAERKIIIERAIALARKREAFNMDRATELRGGTYYEPGGGYQPGGGDGWSDLGEGVRIRQLD